MPRSPWRSFVHGLASVFDPTGALWRIEQAELLASARDRTGDDGQRLDAEAIRGDWAAVADDLRTAFDQERVTPV